MRKYSITESRLREMIQEAVSRALNESIYGGYDENGNFVPSYALNSDFPEQDADHRLKTALGKYPHEEEEERRQQIDADWEALNAFNNQPHKTDVGMRTLYGNRDVDDTEGIASMWSQSDNPSIRRLGRTMRPTGIDSVNADADYVDDIVGEALRRAIRKIR